MALLGKRLASGVYLKINVKIAMKTYLFISVFFTKSISLETAQPNTARALNKRVIVVRHFRDRAAEYSARPQQ